MLPIPSRSTAAPSPLSLPAAAFSRELDGLSAPGNDEASLESRGQAPAQPSSENADCGAPRRRQESSLPLQTTHSAGTRNAPSDSSRKLGRFKTAQIGPTANGVHSREKVLSRQRSFGLHYKAFICEYGAETSIHGRYEFGHLLGEGAMGSTWEGWPRALEGSPLSRSARCEGRRAIKKIVKHCRLDDCTKRFLEEVEVLKELDHPNICKLHESFEDSHAIYLVMDLCEGGELFDRILDGKVGCEQQMAEISRQILHALRYCHETHRIVHRDIKPENVLFVSCEADSPVKLIDFGIACHFKAAEALHETVGTEPYEAPEVLQGADYSEKCDIWSLGALIFCMLSGNMPFASATEAIMGQFSFEGEEWSHVSDAAKDLISKLLVVNADERLSATAVLEHPWLAHGAREHAKAVPNQLAVRLRRFTDTPNFRKILLTLFARHLDTNDLPEIYDAFETLDSDGNGMLSFEEFSKVLRNLMPKETSSEELHDIFNIIDVDGSGKIDYSEFLTAAIDRKLLFREDLCLQVFRSLDRDSSGKISLQELCSLLEDVDTEDFLGSELKNEARELLRNYDADGDGVLDLREFTALLTQNHVDSLSLDKRIVQPKCVLRPHSMVSMGMMAWAGRVLASNAHAGQRSSNMERQMTT